MRSWRGLGRVALIVGVALVVSGGTTAAVLVPRALAPTQRTVVAIGDSIMDGHGLQERQSWPEVVAHTDDWRITDLAADGDGFVTKGNDGTTFTDQVRKAIALHPSTVVLSGSSNDLGVDEATVETTIDREVDLLHAELPQATIVAVSPVWNETAFPAQLTQIAGAVDAAVRGVGGDVLDIGEPLLGHPELMQSDDVHPTAAGQLVIAAAVEEQLQAAGLA